MTRLRRALSPIGLLVTLGILAVTPLEALTLLSPTPDQVVREKVKITLPESALPSDFVVSDTEEPQIRSRPFVSLSIDNAGTEQLLAAFSPEAAMIGNGRVTFYWDSKLPYREPSAPREDKYYKDGRYQLKVNVHDYQGKVVDSAVVDVDLRNKVPRPNPAPAVRLTNRLAYGQNNVYKVRADVQVFQVVSGVGLPILGGMGMSSESRIVQTVEDIRPNGEIMVRYRMDSDGYVDAFGNRMKLYQDGVPKPQLYRLIDKYGNVINRNVFSKQGIYTIMDVLPVLPSRAVKEGDSWPTTCDLKIEGLTEIIPLTGTSMLDSFEWQNGHECAKIISTMGGISKISINNRKIVSSSDKVDVQMVTYFAHKIGKMLRREVSLEFPAHILPGAEQIEATPGSPAASGSPSPMMGPILPSDPTMIEDEEASLGSPSSTPRLPGPLGKPKPKSEASLAEAGIKKGSVHISLVVTLEK